MQNLHLLYPEMGLTAFALALLVADLFLRGRRGVLLYHLGILSAAAALGILCLAYWAPSHYQGIGSLWAVDPLSLFFKVLILGTTIMALLLAADYRAPRAHEHLGTFTALLLLSAVGMMLLVSAVDFLLIFLALELVSISSFILVGFERKDLKSSEAAIKYFLIGAFSSAILVFGISLFYGAIGSTKLLAIHPLFADRSSIMFVMACLLITVGLGFKVSMVPFHLWVPDAYEGAPTPVTAFLSVAPKIAALAVMLRVFTFLVPHTALDLTTLFSVLAMLTMTVGNLTALFQTNIKRLLAYSSIAQAGYMLIGFVTADLLGREGVLIYCFAYLFMNVGAFAVAIVVGNDDGYELESYDGLAKRNLGLALLMGFFLLSLAGIPPMAGFIGKFYLFAAAVKGGFYWLAVVAVLNSVVSIYYYMGVVRHMFFHSPRAAEPAPVGALLYSTLAVAAVGVFVVGVYPEPFLEAVKLSAEFFPQVSAGF
ncbi:MAG: NADH-quinone oxidoreductase subunit N [Elusimicrobiota bacterium]